MNNETDIEEKKAREIRFREAMHLQEIEGNPLTPDEVTMFEMFEREGWSSEQRLEHIRQLVSDTSDAAPKAE